MIKKIPLRLQVFNRHLYLLWSVSPDKIKCLIIVSSLSTTDVASMAIVASAAYYATAGHVTAGVALAVTYY